MQGTSLPPPRSRVHRYSVKHQLEEALRLPAIQQHGFTHACEGNSLMLPREFFVVLAFETHAVSQVILEVLHQTLGQVGHGPGGLDHCVGHFRPLSIMA